MHSVWRNEERTYSACPVLIDAEIRTYLADGALPAKPHFIEVPPWAIVRKRGFWLRPSYRAHVDATVFLISTDTYIMNVDPLEGVRSQIFCYYSEKTGIHYLGRINEADARNGAEKLLLPLIEGLHEPLPLSQLMIRGRVLAAI